MRENMGLYRGKRKDNGEWVEGDLIQLHDGRKYIVNNKFGACIDDKGNFINTEAPFVCEVDPETVGEHIGMTDRKGKKIFEGDITRTITFGFDKDVFITEIKFGARSGVQGFYLANGKMMFYWGQTDLTVMDDTEVIGNIHDNPELLQNTAN